MSAQKWIVLDRDGVINEDSDEYVKSAEEWIPIPGSLEAIARLKRAGYGIAVATNQSGLGRGLFYFDAFEAMCEKMDVLLDQVGGWVDGIFLCPHAPEDSCDCRKPKPGLYHQIIEAFELDSLEGVVTVGDSLRDLQAGRAVGCRPVLVKTGKGERTLERGEGLEGVAVYDDLASVVDALLERQGDRNH
ncbi:MAG: D-glycero-beta-D-manno-heptose 1,7-bisphosphate 7-phosphatase [Pseudomonadota bacterium]